MPARSRARQKAAGGALSAKQDETAPKDLIGAALEMYDIMTKAELEDLAATTMRACPERSRTRT